MVEQPLRVDDHAGAAHPARDASLVLVGGGGGGAGVGGVHVDTEGGSVSRLLGAVVRAGGDHEGGLGLGAGRHTTSLVRNPVIVKALRKGESHLPPRSP